MQYPSFASTVAKMLGEPRYLRVSTPTVRLEGSFCCRLSDILSGAHVFNCVCKLGYVIATPTCMRCKTSGIRKPSRMRRIWFSKSRLIDPLHAECHQRSILISMKGAPLTQDSPAVCWLQEFDQRHHVNYISDHLSSPGALPHCPQSCAHVALSID